jgi:hypothetical protein
MAQFRFETEVQVTKVFEYHIEADTLEEAMRQLETGEHRDRGWIIETQEHWETELIADYEVVEDEEE